MASEETALKQIRSEVFLIEQNVPKEDEWDEHDDSKHTLHFLVRDKENNIGTARVIIKKEEQLAHIGRVAIVKQYRHQGIATRLLKNILDELSTREINSIYLHSQTYICELYEKLGFQKEGCTFFDAGIEHQKMALKIHS